MSPKTLLISVAVVSLALAACGGGKEAKEKKEEKLRNDIHNAKGDIASTAQPLTCMLSTIRTNTQIRCKT